MTTHAPPSRPATATQAPASRIGLRPTCPRCGAVQHGTDLDAGQAWLRCERSCCRATFYALVVEPGEPIPTLASPMSVDAPRVVSVLASPALRRDLRGRPRADVLAGLGITPRHLRLV